MLDLSHETVWMLNYALQEASRELPTGYTGDSVVCKDATLGCVGLRY